MKKQKSDIEIKPFTADEREQLLQEIALVRASIRAEGRGGTITDGQRMRELWKQYDSGLPRVPISRCPFTSAIIQIPLDTFGLNGPRWDSEVGIHLDNKSIQSPHYWTLSGAVRLADSLDSGNCFVCPGPEVPFVVSDLFKADYFKAVIYQISIGSHVAYPIVYFAAIVHYAEEKRTQGRGVIPFPAWFSDYAYYTTCVIQTGKHAGKFVFHVTSENITHYSDMRERADFDLEKWIRSGHVLWIAPGDESMTLRSDVEGCPYLNLPGTKEFLCISKGQARYSGGRGIYREG